MKSKLKWKLYTVALVSAITLSTLAYFSVDTLMRDPPNYTKIEDGLYMGGHVDAPPPNTQAVLNLCERADDYRTEVYEWQPIPDGAPAPEISWLERQVNLITAQRNNNLTLYVHCNAGVSRSALVMIAYLMKRDGLSLAQATQKLQTKRPNIRPHSAFIPLLLEWEAKLRASTQP